VQELAQSWGCRARGNGPEPRQHWRSGQKKSQPIRVGISNYGGAGSPESSATSLMDRRFMFSVFLSYPVKLPLKKRCCPVFGVSLFFSIITLHPYQLGRLMGFVSIIAKWSFMGYFYNHKILSFW
jgi:hypothetical protein